MSGKIHTRQEHCSEQKSILEGDLKIIRSLLRAPINFANLLRNSLLLVTVFRTGHSVTEQKTQLIY
jgi:hypothetical protein